MSLLNPQLEAFMATIEYGTVHAAAQSLHITQTAATQRIQNLEARLKTTLFIRSKRGMQLTEEGLALLRYCRTMKELAGETLAAMQQGGTTHNASLTLSAPTSITNSRLIPRALAVMQAFPNLLLRFDVSDEADIDNKLRLGKADLAVIDPTAVTKEMQHKTLKPDQYLLVCSAKWKGRRLKNIISEERIIDFHPQDSMTFNYLKKYDLLEYAQHERYFANRTEAIAKLVIAGNGYSVLTKEFSQPYINSQQMIALNKGQLYLHELALAWYTRPQPPAYFQAIIDAID